MLASYRIVLSSADLIAANDILNVQQLPSFTPFSTPNSPILYGVRHCSLSPHVYHACFNLLSMVEQRRCCHIKNATRRLLFVLGRVLLRRAISDVFDVDMMSVDIIQPCERSKPFSSVCSFNISYSGDLLIVVLGISGDVGVDIERISSGLDINEIANYFLPLVYQDYIRSFPAHAQCLAFYESWTYIESRCKLTGHGLTGAPLPLPPDSSTFLINFADLPYVGHLACDL